jgi:hypothetical protein
MRGAESIPDDRTEMAPGAIIPEFDVTKVTSVRATRANADDRTVQAQTNGQFLHNPAAVPASTPPGVGRP